MGVSSLFPHQLSDTHTHTHTHTLVFVYTVSPLYNNTPPYTLIYLLCVHDYTFDTPNATTEIQGSSLIESDSTSHFPV